MTLSSDAIHFSAKENGQFGTLTHFFDEMHRIWPSLPAVPDATSLAEFLSEFRRLNESFVEPDTSAPEALLDSDAFAAFCQKFRPLYEELHLAGEFIDVWTVAGLRRDELRHASILAWLLNPLGTHGFGSSVFERWVSKLRFSSESSLTNLADWHGDYRVATEVCPSDDGGDRVDIEIDGKDFYLCVEVKIDAPEGDQQLDRYSKIARLKAASRPFAVIYLTPERPARKSMDDSLIVRTTWCQFADSIRGHSRPNNGLSDRLMTQFLRRVEKL
jgi:hypothetical protein